MAEDKIKKRKSAITIGGNILLAGFLLLLFSVPVTDFVIIQVRAHILPDKTAAEDFVSPYHPNRDFTYSRYGDLSDLLAAPQLVRRYGLLREYHIRTDSRGFFTPPGSSLENSKFVVAGDSFTLGASAEETLAGLIVSAPGQTRGSAYSLGAPVNNILSFLILYPPLVNPPPTPRRHLIIVLCKRNLTADLYSNYLAQYSPMPSELKRKLLIYRIKKYLPDRLFDRMRDRSRLIIYTNRIVTSLKLSMGIAEDQPRIIVGGDDVLFYSNDVYFWKKEHPKDEIQRIGDSISFLNNEAAKRGFKMLLVMVPDKSDVYPELLPEELRPAGDPTEKYFEGIASELQSRNVSAVNLLPIFRSAAKNKMLYFKDDTHWNIDGKKIAVNSILYYIKKTQSK